MALFYQSIFVHFAIFKGESSVNVIEFKHHLLLMRRADYMHSQSSDMNRLIKV